MEVCVDNIQSAVNAAKGGATRVELCSSLSEGGLTPSIGTFKILKKLIDIPIFVLLRPRRGTDFVYSEEEILSMMYDAEEFKNAGADGLVFGILKEDGTINIKACCDILKSVNIPMHLTFNRAFDCVADPINSLDLIKNLGFSRILTSGQKNSALEGKDLIKQLIKVSDNGIIVVPAGGVNEDTALEILDYTGAKELHGSVRKPVKQKFDRNSSITMGSTDFDNNVLITDVNAVKKVVSILRKYI